MTGIFTGKTALVTGATGGIGGEIARALHRQGAKVAVSGTRREVLETLAAEIGNGPVNTKVDVNMPALKMAPGFSIMGLADTYALKGDVNKGLFFRGSEPLPFGSAIRPVAELMEYLLTGNMAQSA